MTAYPIGSTEDDVPRLASPPVSVPMPRLGRAFVWSDIVAEIERDNRARMRDAEAS